MKKFWPILLLILAGCSTTDDLSSYKYISYVGVYAKVKGDLSNEGLMYNLWRYAGSDDKYDYVYEFTPGIFLRPNSGFKFYKLDKGQIQLELRYPFHPDPKSNTEIFSWGNPG